MIRKLGLGRHGDVQLHRGCVQEEDLTSEVDDFRGKELELKYEASRSCHEQVSEFRACRYPCRYLHHVGPAIRQITQTCQVD